MKTEFQRGRPAIHIQQVGCSTAETDEQFHGCYELREFISGVDYFDLEVNEFRGTVVRRRIDGKIFAVPDYRFCRNASFEVLWLWERRKARQLGDVVIPQT